MNKLETLIENVLGAVFEVANTLGAGFLEKVYERALVRELGLRGIRGAAQAPLTVAYKGLAVGEYFVDVLVEGVLVVELKCVERLANEHTAQKTERVGDRQPFFANGAKNGGCPPSICERRD